MDELIRLRLPDEVTSWLRVRADEWSAGGVQEYIAGLVTQEYLRRQGRPSHEEIREQLDRYYEWERTAAPPEYFEEQATWEQALGEDSLKHAEELRQRAATAARRQAGSETEACDSRDPYQR